MNARLGRRTSTPRSDLTYAWANEPRLAAWRKAFIEWSAEHTSRLGALKASNAALSVLMAHRNLARSPEEFCRRSYTSPVLLHTNPKHAAASNAILTNSLHAFFDWFLDKKLTTIDKHGHAVRSTKHWNPIPVAPVKSRVGQTARDALPPRILRALLDKLTRNDWEWAKAIDEDWASVVDSTTHEHVRVWCPVRATALAIKLMLPLRTFQVRMLESGEGDSERCVDGRWIPNPSPHAPRFARRKVRRGFLRAFRNRFAGTTSTGFFVNTNKTADRVPDEIEAGYEMPWQHDRVIRVVEQLERWQERYNPVEPLLWRDIHERQVRLATQPRPGGAFFLMRDPNGTYPNEPVTEGRVGYLWDRLMEACERELASSGERLPDGDPIVLTALFPTWQKRKHITVRRSLYDLHSLRVSLLTALAIDGGVPLHVLSQCVAGHKSLVMTLHYLKTDPDEINRTLRDAEAKLEAGRSKFLRSLRSNVRKATGYVADQAGIAALDRSRTASWHVMDTGVCPVGGTRCGDGGPAIGKDRYGPVPGGRNCPRCRFHITGPSFLPGLVARFNAVSMRIERTKEQLKLAEKVLEEAENARFDAEQMGQPVDPTALALARERCDDAMIAMDAEVGTLQEVAVLVERCKETLRKSHSTKPSLILNGDLKSIDAGIRLTQSVELWDTVCRAAHVYPDAAVSEARVKRAEIINRMLVRTGRAPILLMLSPDDALKVADEMIRLMTAQLGADRAFQVISDENANVETAVAAIIDRAMSTSTKIFPTPLRLMENKP